MPWGMIGPAPAGDDQGDPRLEALRRIPVCRLHPLPCPTPSRFPLVSPNAPVRRSPFASPRAAARLQASPTRHPCQGPMGIPGRVPALARHSMPRNASCEHEERSSEDR